MEIAERLHDLAADGRAGPRDPVRRPRRVARRQVHRRRAAGHALDPHGQPALAGGRRRRGHEPRDRREGGPRPGGRRGVPGRARRRRPSDGPVRPRSPRCPAASSPTTTSTHASRSARRVARRRSSSRGGRCSSATIRTSPATTPAALDRAKRINVAHDWLSDPALRARYDARPPGPRRRRRPAAPAGPGTGPRVARQPVGPPARRARHPSARRTPVHASGPRPRRPRRAARPVPRARRAASRPTSWTGWPRPSRRRSRSWPRSAASSRRRRAAAFAEVEAALAARVPRERWAEVGLREGLLGVAAELVLAAVPRRHARRAVPRSRARERLLRAWDASLDQPRYGPNGAGVAAVRDRVAAMTRDEVAAFLRASQGIAGDDRPWPAALDRDEDEALRISAAARRARRGGGDPGRRPAPGGGDEGPAPGRRASGHVIALRHAFAAATYARSSGRSWRRPAARSSAAGTPRSAGPDVPPRTLTTGGVALLALARWSPARPTGCADRSGHDGGA